MKRSCVSLLLRFRIPYILVFLYLSLPLFSQVPNFTWAKNAARGTGYGSGDKITIDASDNVYLVGTFSGTIDADPGPLTVSLVSAGSSDVFISKFNSSGTLQWAKRVGGTFFDGGNDIKLDASGNIYVCGQHYGIADLDPGVGTFTVPGSLNGSGFIVKLDNSGNFIWGKALVGSSASLFQSFDIDGLGNLYFTGNFNNVTDFDPDAPTFTMTTIGGSDAFVLKLNSSGVFQWAKNIGDAVNEYASSIKCDATGNPIIQGEFTSSILDLDPGPGTFTISNAGGYDVFILKLDATGNFMWAKKLGGSSNDLSFGLEVDATGDIFSTGGFYSPDADFDPGPGTFTLAANPLDEEIFCVKLSQNGNFLWANKFGGNLYDRSYAITVDNTGGVYLTGRFEGTADFDPGPSSFTLSVVGQQDVFISKLNSSNGNFVWARSFGSINSERGNSILVNSSGDVFSCGYFYSGSAVDFDPGPSSLTITSAGVEDAFIHKMSQCSPPALPINATIITTLCSAGSASLMVTGTGTLNWYNLPSNGILLSTGSSYNTPTLTAGNYTYYVEAVNSCTTSLSRTAITITVFPNPTITVISSATLLCMGQNATLSANGANSYTWSPGGNGLTIVISPTLTTSYTITGLSNGCIGSSVFSQSVISCTNIEELNSNQILINTYPNPNNGNFIIETNDLCKLVITDPLGKVLFERILSKGQNSIDIKNYPNGVYFANVYTVGKYSHSMIIKN